MVSTKAEILALLKRNGGHSISELAEALHLATITVRQHVTHLERDGLIVREQRQPGTRGQHVFCLTAKAHAAAFPRRSDRLVELLVREVGFLEGQELVGLSTREKTLLIVRRLAQRVAEEYAPLLQGWPLQERVVFVTEVMHADGGFAEWAKTGEGAFEIRDFNCLFHRLLEHEATGDVCEWHRSFLSRVLGADVRVSPCPDATTRCCRYVIEAVTMPALVAVGAETA
jgi:predicted ArsR family transcriptional regulator